MRKLLLALALLAGAALGARADSPAAPQPTTAVADAYQSTASCYGIQVSSYGDTMRLATEVIPSTMTLWRNVSLQNLDASATTYCAPWNASVSSQTANAAGNIFTQNVGFEVLPVSGTNPQPYPVPLYPGELLYCVNGTVNGRQTILVVCPGR